MSAIAGTRSTEISDLHSTQDPFNDTPKFTAEEKTEITFEHAEISNKDDNKLFCRYWKPAGKIKALVMMMHGYAEHLKWYHHVGVSLANQGYLAFGHDHMGHGKSEGLRVLIGDVTDLVDDAFLHVEKMQNLFPNTPTFLVGHSMGGMVALLTAVKHPNLFKGVVFNGPFIMLGADVRSPIKKWCARTFCKFLPNAQVGKLNMNDVTGDEEMIKKINDDPLWWQGGVKLKTGAAFLDAVENINEHFTSVKVPFLIIHGADDKICDPEGSKALMNMSPSSDKILKLYPGAAHHLYLDAKNIRDVAVQDTVDWISERVLKNTD